jgi:hypothetical protein
MGGKKKASSIVSGLFIAVNGDSPAARILSWAARMGAEAKVFQQTAMKEGGSSSAGRRAKKKKDFIYIYDQSPAISHDDGPYTTHRVRGILYKKGGEGIMKEERLSSTSSWSVSSLPAGHV